MDTTYNDLVASDEQTCGACPTQWEGQLKDGRMFYFRYRHGYAWLGVGYTINSAIAGIDGSAGVVIDRMADGFMDDNEYREVFTSLYSQI